MMQQPTFIVNWHHVENDCISIMWCLETLLDLFKAHFVSGNHKSLSFSKQKYRDNEIRIKYL